MRELEHGERMALISLSSAEAERVEWAIGAMRKGLLESDDSKAWVASLADEIRLSGVILAVPVSSHPHSTRCLDEYLSADAKYREGDTAASRSAALKVQTEILRGLKQEEEMR